ncbi:MAG: sialate O-acetylesterase [Lentisphaerae bacterium]|nr:sialate O-acetylesterase [Lentisphaerota bacterium]
MLKLKNVLTLAAVFSAALAVEAKVVPAQIFTDNMVLQQGKQVPVWGKADPHESVSVSFAGQSVSGKADASGKWLVRLSPMSASFDARDLVIKGASNTVTLQNVLVGEVWLGGGQSNMDMCMWSDNPRWRATNGDKDAAAGANKNIRVATLRQRVWAQLPETQYRGTIQWEELTPEVGQKFSATAFYFAQNIYKELNVPVGVVVSCWSGSRIDPWIPPEGFSSVPELADIAYTVKAKLPGTDEYKKVSAQTAERYEKWLLEFKKASAAGQLLPVLPDYPAELRPYADVRQPTVMYNSMITPLLPFAFRGIIWYQGCSNLGEGMLYKHKMLALLNGWRQLFQQDDLAFYFVQLAPYNYGGNPTRLPEIWEAQQAFAESMPSNVAMAVINDVGDYGDIHPHDKATVGKRLSLLALKYTYNKSVAADSPVLTKWEKSGNRFVLEFKNVTAFQSKGAPQNFEVAGAAGKWYPAQVKLDGARIIVWSDEVKSPRQLQYMWHQMRTGNIFNESGLPLGAFRCGSLAGKEELFRDLAENFQLVYEADMLKVAGKDGSIQYTVDNSNACKGNIKRLAYVMELTGKDGSYQWAVAMMDPFTGDVKKIGVPVAKARIFYGGKVNNLTVYSNVPGVKTGFFSQGNIEFWSGNYTAVNQFKIAGASGSTYDFGDSSSGYGVGYGSMQIHNFAEKQTVMAYNNFTNPDGDAGIGNAPAGHPDWTFSKSRPKYSKATLKVYALME